MDAASRPCGVWGSVVKHLQSANLGQDISMSRNKSFHASSEVPWLSRMRLRGRPRVRHMFETDAGPKPDTPKAFIYPRSNAQTLKS